MVLYINNAFSLQMIEGSNKYSILIDELPEKNVRQYLKNREFISCVGHSDTAEILTEQLGQLISFNRMSIKLKEDDILIVAQIQGGRLPEGCKTLPKGYSFKYFRVSVKREN